MMNCRLYYEALELADRIAQMIARTYAGRAIEPVLCQDFYGYRPHKSALGVVEKTVHGKYPSPVFTLFLQHL